jgi:tRNA (mo5U34)-methyltransferase
MPTKQWKPVADADAAPVFGYAPPFDLATLERQVRDLGDWFHNLDLHGVHTAPNHFLGDFPNIKWKNIRQAIPEDLTGASVLDIGCNGGFYSLEMKKRGASRVLGIDIDERYLRQARFAARTLDLDIEFQRCSVYEIDRIPGQFDFVVFMGVLYHLRYPLYALDMVAKKVAGKLLFQTMIRGSEQARAWEKNYTFWTKDIFRNPDFPAMYFIEHSYAGDPTNWWVPNASAVEAMLRSAGFDLLSHPEVETWLCQPGPPLRAGRDIRQQELAGYPEDQPPDEEMHG